MKRPLEVALLFPWLVIDPQDPQPQGNRDCAGKTSASHLHQVDVSQEDSALHTLHQDSIKKFVQRVRRAWEFFLVASPQRTSSVLLSQSILGCKLILRHG